MSINQTPLLSFHLPSYKEVPDVGLYLDQVVRYINECLAPFEELFITPSMLSNYVKKGYIEKPIKKQYFRDQICYLLFMAVTKQVLSLDHIHTLQSIQQSTYDTEHAYESFRQKFQSMLSCLFNGQEEAQLYPKDATFEQHMLQSVIISTSHLVYLNYCLHHYPESGQ